MNTTTEEVLARIFPPDGQHVPIDIARNWTSIERAVARLVSAMNGKPFVKILTASQLAARNERIYQILNENPDVPLKSIAYAAGVTLSVVKHAKERRRQLATVRNDQIVEKVHHQETKSEQNESVAEDLQKIDPDQPTIQKDQEVETIEKAPGPKIPHSEDEFIIQQRDGGKLFREILEELKEKGIECTVDDVMARYYFSKKKRDQESRGKQPHNTLTPKEAGRRTREPAPKSPEIMPEAEPPASEAKQSPEPRAISRAELDQRIWDLWKAGKTPEQISDELYAEGLYYSEKSVRIRLVSQGAEL